MCTSLLLWLARLTIISDNTCVGVSKSCSQSWRIPPWLTATWTCWTATEMCGTAVLRPRHRLAEKCHCCSSILICHARFRSCACSIKKDRTTSKSYACAVQHSDCPHLLHCIIPSQLRTLLETYACFRPDLGYIQGMSYLAAMICLYLPDEL